LQRRVASQSDRLRPTFVHRVGGGQSEALQQSYNVRRGLEQRLYLDTWSNGVLNIPVGQAIDAVTGLASLNRQRPMASAGVSPLRLRVYNERLELAQNHISECL